jgi:hypothetical protein
MFIANLAISRGCIHKVLYYENLQGGSADLEKAARIVI